METNIYLPARHTEENKSNRALKNSKKIRFQRQQKDLEWGVCLSQLNDFMVYGRKENFDLICLACGWMNLWPDVLLQKSHPTAFSNKYSSDASFLWSKPQKGMLFSCVPTTDLEIKVKWDLESGHDQGWFSVVRAFMFTSIIHFNTHSLQPQIWSLFPWQDQEAELVWGTENCYRYRQKQIV